MTKGYWIIRVDVNDQEQFKLYADAASVALKKYSAKFLARAGRSENPEGTTRLRNSVIEFPSYEDAVNCWHSSEYQETIKLRLSVSTMDLVIIEGYDGLQPS